MFQNYQNHKQNYKQIYKDSPLNYKISHSDEYKEKKEPPEVLRKKSYTLNFLNIPRKTPALKSLLIKLQKLCKKPALETCPKIRKYY